MSPPLRTGLVVVAGAAGIALGARLSVPMVPVPTTLQTFALVLVALLAGPRIGAASAGAYLLGVLLGLPLLSDGRIAAGPAFFGLPTAGYVLGFVPGAAIAGAVAQRAPRLSGRFGAAVLGHLAVLAVGTPVLAAHVGVPTALERGLLILIPGLLVKSAVATGLVELRDAVRRSRAPSGDGRSRPSG